MYMYMYVYPLYMCTLHNYILYLQCIHSTYETTDFAFAYFSYGATCAEVELDVLTGETQVIRVDTLYDCGER